MPSGKKPSSSKPSSSEKPKPLVMGVDYPGFDMLEGKNGEETPLPPRKEHSQGFAIKYAKLENDPCFGEKYEQIEQCNYCWVKESCYMRFKNRK